MTDDNVTPESTPEVLPEAGPEVSSDDRLWGALSYFALIAIIMLLMEEKKKRPFIKFHAVQALALSVVVAIATFLVGLIPVAGWCIAPFLWLILLWPAIGAFGGKYTEIPVVTNFIKNQGWVGSA